MAQLPTSKLYAATRTALINRPRTVTYDTISAATGIDPKWLGRFAKYKQPCVHKTEALYEYLTGKPLTLEPVTQHALT